MSPNPSAKYQSLKYPKVDIFEGKYPGKSAIIIGTGMSTLKLLPYRDRLKKKFDVIIGLNRSATDFEQYLDFHVVMDRFNAHNFKYINWLDEGYRRDLPRIFNYASIGRFPQDLNLVKAVRCKFGGQFGRRPNIRKLHHDGYEGLLMGPPNKQGLSVGTPLVPGIHFAGILGCDRIFMIGVDMFFGKEYDHYNKDRFYRDNECNTKPANRSPITTVMHNGEEYETTQYFLDSVKYINEELIPGICRPNGIEVFDFSGGLLSSSINVDIDEFFQKVIK